MSGKKLGKPKKIQSKKTLLLHLGTIGFILICLSFFLVLPKQDKAKTVSAALSSSATINALSITDITGASISFSPPSSNSIGSGDIIFGGYNSNGSLIHTFGQYKSDGLGYTDDQTADTPLPLMINVNSETHTAKIITLKTNLNENKVICIPEKNTSNISYELFNSPLPGIKTALAQVNIDNINPDTKIPAVTSYYVDTNGNVYLDYSLDQPVNTVNCQITISNYFVPNNINNITIDSQFDLGGLNSITFAKSWETVLGFYNSDTGFIDFESDDFGSAAPLFVTGGNTNEQTTILPEMTITITTNLGVNKICSPEQVLEPKDWFIYFIDKEGNPYSDIMFNSSLPCSSLINECDTVSCDDNPTHECCDAKGATPLTY